MQYGKRMSWFGHQVSLFSGIDAFVELTVAITLLLGVRSRLQRIPPLAWLFAVYFLTEAALSFSRVFVRSNLEATLDRIVVLELFGTILVLLMLARARQIASALVIIIDEARFRASEYRRAQHDYTQVVRHRIANPLMVIRGAAQTLELGALDEPTRHELRLAIITASEQLEAISLGPEQGGPEEHEFDAIPRVDRSDHS